MVFPDTNSIDLSRGVLDDVTTSTSLFAKARGSHVEAGVRLVEGESGGRVASHDP